MNPLKLTLLFCLFTTILCGQQEYPGYIVKQEGDTLRGRITLMPNVIKFKQDNVKTKYFRSELADYGYYANRKFYPKPDETPPAKESDMIGTIVLANGDTLQNFYVHFILTDVIVGYFEYPKYISYRAEEGKLLDLTVNEGVRKATETFNLFLPAMLDETPGVLLTRVKDVPYASVDLIELKGFPKKGQTYPMYSNRIFERGEEFRAYNVNREKPYQKIYEETTASFLVGAVATIPGLIVRRSGEPILRLKKGGLDDWIIYKNGEIYTIQNFREWKKMFNVIFEGEDEFIKSLEWQDIKMSNIVEVLKAYSNF